MAQNIILKRSAVAGRVPDTSSLNLGEVAINTFDGKLYFKKSGSVESVETIVTTDSITSGSIFVSEDITTQRDLYVIRDVITDGDIDAAGSLSGSGLSINDTLTVHHNKLQLTGSAVITGSLTVLGEINARQFNINIISSSVIFESGSSKFGNSADDTHSFTGSVDITGSLYVNGVEVGAEGGGSYTGSFTGSFFGDGSGLRNVVTDDLPIDGWDYDSNSSASISEFNNESRKYLIDFQWEQEVGTPIGFKTFISNVTGSSQIVPTNEGIKFIVGNQLVATVGPEGINATLPNGVVSGSSQLTSSYDSRYVLSGSVQPLPDGVVSGSVQISNLGFTTTGSNTFVGTQILSGSIIPATDNTYDLGSATYQWRDIYVSSGSLYIDGTKVLGSTGNELQITTDAGQSIKILEAGSDSIILQSADGDIQLKTSGGGNLLFDPTTGLIDVRGTLQIQDGYKITSSGGNSIQFGSDIGITGSINGINLSSFSSSLNSRIVNVESNSLGFATTGSNTFIGTQVITGSLYVTTDLIVQGSSSLQNITASAVSIGTNTVILNTATPAVRFGGISVADSGSGAGTSGSLYWDSINNNWIYQHPSGGVESGMSAILISGPKNSGSLGDEVHITPNKIMVAIGDDHIGDSIMEQSASVIKVEGSISASVIGIGNVTSYSSSVASRIITIEGKYATTGSNTFVGNQIITGSISSTKYGIFKNDGSTGYSLLLDSPTSSTDNDLRFAKGGVEYGAIQTNADTTHNFEFYVNNGSSWYNMLYMKRDASAVVVNTGTLLPGSNGTQDMGSASLRWGTIYTSDLSLSNGIGDYTIVEGEDDLFLYNNKKNKVYKFALIEVDPNTATPKKS